VKHARVALGLLMCMGAVGIRGSQFPAGASAEPLEELARAEAKWQVSKAEAYEFRFQYACNGMIAPRLPDVPPGVLIRVKGGESTYLEAPGAAPVSAAAELVQYSTVEKLFASIRKAWADRPSDPQPGDLMGFNVRRFRMDVEYDPARGYPTRLCVDPDTIVSDNEFGFLITDFKILLNLQETDSPTAQMKADVDLLVVRAKTLKRLWPWQPAIPEVARVARHGKRVAPLLIELLDDDPDPVLEDRIDHGVQQQAALALCKIYRVIDQCGRVYCNRASTEENKAVKQFWRAKISE
jgi:uncharacterized protein DUF6174